MRSLEGNVTMAHNYSMDVGTKVLHFIVLVLNLGVAIALMASALGAKKEYTPFFMSNSFLSAYESDGSVVTYTPYAKPRVASQLKETYLYCLQEARVGVNDMYKCKAESTSAYRECLLNLTTSDTRLDRLVTSIKEAIGRHGSNVSSIVQLPTRLTSAPDAMKEYLRVDSQRDLVKRSLVYQSSPVSVEILSAIDKFNRAAGPLSCADSLQSQVTASSDTGKLLAAAWDCTANSLITEPINKIAYEKCIPFEVWPTHDIMQTQYSLSLFGAYNKYFFLIIGAWIMASFCVYTLPGYSSETTEYGKPESWFARAGKAFTLFAFVWNLAAILIVLVRGFTPGDSWENFPMSIQTVMFSGFFALAVSIYFGREVYELFIRSGGATGSAPANKTAEATVGFAGQHPESSSSVGTASRYSGGRRYQVLNAFMRVDGSLYHKTLTEAQYTPLVAPAWNDVWVFVDSIFFLGVVGATSKDLVTADLVLVVFCIFVINLMNSALIRLLYEGYINEVPSDSALFKNFEIRSKSRQDVYANRTTLYSIRVMAMVASLTSFILALIVLLHMIFRYSFQPPTLYIVFSCFIPQVYWLVVNVLMDFAWISDPYTMYYKFSLFFSYNVLIRSIFLFVCWTTMNEDYNLTINNDDSLNKLLDFVNTDK